VPTVEHNGYVTGRHFECKSRLRTVLTVPMIAIVTLRFADRPRSLKFARIEARGSVLMTEQAALNTGMI
jgi:hypothetical protein